MYQESYKYLRPEPYVVPETEESTTLPQIRVEGRFYCPFCGTLIQTPKKFCPKCGENLKDIIGN
ncbi:MAG: zinc-ribbon domain-containing protein, partial [Candidatus Lokiarchaeota archaeon]|nr:zinc-ribbon domain-containing protein [Candidatus Lokiarchaeota archaeon]